MRRAFKLKIDALPFLILFSIVAGGGAGGRDALRASGKQERSAPGLTRNSARIPTGRCHIAGTMVAIDSTLPILVFIIWPPPSTVAGWFELFQSSKLVGLLDLDLMLIVDQVLTIPIYLALYFSLRRTNHSFMVISIALVFTGITAYFASGSAFEMLSISGRYAAAETEAERSMLITAGQIVLLNWQGTAFNVGYVLQGAGFLIAALVTYRSTVFSKSLAYVAIAGGVLMLLPPTAGTVGMACSFASLTPLEIWDIMVGWKFLRLGGAEESIPEITGAISPGP